MSAPGWLSAVAGDAETAARLGEAAQLADMVRVEAAFSRALGAVGQVPADMAEGAARVIEAARIDMERLSREAAQDGMPVPSLSRQLRDAVPEDLRGAVHKGLTSQDVMDCALLLALRDVLDSFETRIGTLQGALADLSGRFGAAPLMARTRMQAALPITVADRIGTWQRPLETHLARLAELRPRLLRIQLGGPVGDRGTFGDAGDGIADSMAEILGLYPAVQAWHTDRSALAELGGWLSLLSGHLGKIGHDICLMVQQGVGTARISGGGTSSAMAHKANPVRAETLISLARVNAAQLAGMHMALDHEQERSGAAWTLEWLLLPRMAETTGAGLLRAAGLLEQIEALGDGADEG